MTLAGALLFAQGVLVGCASSLFGGAVAKPMADVLPWSVTDDGAAALLKLLYSVDEVTVTAADNDRFAECGGFGRVAAVLALIKAASNEADVGERIGFTQFAEGV